MSYQFTDEKEALEASSEPVELNYTELETSIPNLQSLAEHPALKHLSVISEGSYKPKDPCKLEHAIDVLCSTLVQNQSIQYFAIVSSRGYADIDFEMEDDDSALDIFHDPYFEKICQALSKRSKVLQLGFSAASFGFRHYERLLQVIQRNPFITAVEWYDRETWVDTSAFFAGYKIYDNIVRQMESALEVNQDFIKLLNGEGLPMTPFLPAEGQEQLINMVRGFDSGAKFFLNSRGFHFVLSSLFTGKRIIQAPDSPFKGQLHLDAENKIGEKIKQKTLVNGSEKDQALFVLSSEYKIHLMPKPHYMMMVVKILLQAFNEDPELLSHIYSFKVKVEPKETKRIAETPAKKIMPHIVIYLDLGKGPANIVVNKLYEYFAKFNTRELGLNVPARYSLLLNGLMSYAQGGGDLKNVMTDSQKEDFLSQSEVHYNLPDQHLQNPMMPDLDYFKKCLQEAMNGLQLNVRACNSVVGNLLSPLPQVRFWSHTGTLFQSSLLQDFYNQVLKPLKVEPPVNGQDEQGHFVAILLPGCIQMLRSNGFKNELLRLAKAFLEIQIKLQSTFKDSQESGPSAKRARKTGSQASAIAIGAKDSEKPNFHMFMRSQAKLLELAKKGMMTRGRSASANAGSNHKVSDSKEKAEEADSSSRRGKKRKRE